jgi:hypothetical protein
VLVYYNEISKKIVEYENKLRTPSWRMKHPSFWIIIIYYRNEPQAGRPPVPFQNITAELSYENGTDDPLVIPRGLWFPENVSAVDIPYNDIRGLIVAEAHNTETLVELGTKQGTVSIRLFQPMVQ